MRCVFPTRTAVFVSPQAVRIVLLVLRGRVISAFANRTRHADDLPHLISLQARGYGRGAIGAPSSLALSPHCLSPIAHRLFHATISVTTPEPTVLPPSRIANRSP